MTRKDLVTELSDKTGLPYSDSKKALECLLEIMGDAFSRNECIYLRGFGTYKTYQTKEKKARIITKGESVIVPPHRVVKLIPSKELIHKLNQKRV